MNLFLKNLTTILCCRNGNYLILCNPGKFLRWFTAVCCLLMLVACDEYKQDDYREIVVLEAYVVANQPLPEVRVSTTLPHNQAYYFSDAALEGANIQIVLLDENDTEVDLFGYIPSSTKGVYIPEDTSHLVESMRKYRIYVDFNDRDEILRAETIIPDDFRIINEIPESIVYQAEEQLEIIISATKKVQKQNVFVFNAIAGNPVPENLTPFWKALLEDENLNIEEFYNHSLELVNEGFFDKNPDGTIRFNYPWAGIPFIEENQLVVNSIDKNLSDLISSHEIHLGGSTLFFGEIPNLHYNIEGGVGIFGGIAADTVKVYVERP